LQEGYDSEEERRLQVYIAISNKSLDMMPPSQKSAEEQMQPLHQESPSVSDPSVDLEASSTIGDAEVQVRSNMSNHRKNFFLIRILYLSRQP